MNMLRRAQGAFAVERDAAIAVLAATLPEILVTQRIVFEQVRLRGRQAQQRVLLPIG